MKIKPLRRFIKELAQAKFQISDEPLQMDELMEEIDKLDDYVKGEYLANLVELREKRIIVVKDRGITGY
jgi:hypothetical protein